MGGTGKGTGKRRDSASDALFPGCHGGGAGNAAGQGSAGGGGRVQSAGPHHAPGQYALRHTDAGTEGASGCQTYTLFPLGNGTGKTGEYLRSGRFLCKPF